MSDGKLISSLLDKWEEARAKGQDLSPEVLCRHYPELLGDVRQRIAKLRQMDLLLSTGSPEESSNLIASNTDHLQEDITATDTPAQLGRYERRLLRGRGGFGEVWKGYDPKLKRTVAIKIRRPDRRISTKEFQAEAQKVAQLAHPGIVTVHDFGIANELCFIISEWIDGPNLAELTLKRRLSYSEAARVVAQVADALAYAHSKGFVHRDVKPSNILVDKTRGIVLADFGIAATRGELAREAFSGKGTTPYMAPEQVYGEGVRITPATDVYAMGVVLYELLTGDLPFKGTAAETIKQIISGTPWAPRSIDRKIPQPLEDICLKAMEKKPPDRYRTAADLAVAIRTFLGTTGPDSHIQSAAVSDQPRPPHVSRKRLLRIACRAGLLVFLVACFAYPKTFHAPLSQLALTAVNAIYESPRERGSMGDAADRKIGPRIADETPNPTSPGQTHRSTGEIRPRRAVAISSRPSPAKEHYTLGPSRDRVVADRSSERVDAILAGPPRREPPLGSQPAERPQHLSSVKVDGPAVAFQRSQKHQVANEAADTVRLHLFDLPNKVLRIKTHGQPVPISEPATGITRLRVAVELTVDRGAYSQEMRTVLPKLATVAECSHKAVVRMRKQNPMTLAMFPGERSSWQDWHCLPFPSQRSLDSSPVWPPTGLFIPIEWYSLPRDQLQLGEEWQRARATQEDLRKRVLASASEVGTELVPLEVASEVSPVGALQITMYGMPAPTHRVLKQIDKARLEIDLRAVDGAGDELGSNLAAFVPAFHDPLGVVLSSSRDGTFGMCPGVRPYWYDCLSFISSWRSHLCVDVSTSDLPKLTSIQISIKWTPAEITEQD